MRPGYFGRSWSMFKTSWTVLKQDRELLWLAVMNFLVSLAAVLVAGLFVLVVGILSSIGSSDDSWFGNPHVVVFFVAGLFVAVAIAIANAFFHGAIVYGTFERLSGGDPTVKSAMAGARSKMRLLVLWGLTALCISWLINLIQHLLERIRFVGWILGSLVEMAWNVLKFLVIPIVIVEGLGPFASLKRSRELLRSTWGDNLIGQLGLGLIGFLLVIPGALFILLFVLTGFVPLIVLGAVVGGIYILGVILFVSALNSVFQSVLYHYAVRGQVPSGFDSHDVSAAFAPRKGSGFGGFGTTGSTTGF